MIIIVTTTIMVILKICTEKLSYKSSFNAGKADFKINLLYIYIYVVIAFL